MRRQALRRQLVEEDEPVEERNQHLDIEEMRRTIQQLQQRLERFERQDPPRHDRRRADEEDEGINPFHNEDESSDDSFAYPRRRIHRRSRDGDVRVDVPEYDGQSQDDAFLDWLYTVERIFEFKDYSDEKRVKLVAIKLKKYASLWWENLRREREREGRRPIRTWEKMKRELRKRFISDNYKQDNYVKFHNFRQFELPVADYTREFEYLMLKCDVVEPEERTIARYLGGLKKEISDVIKLQPYWTFNDVRKLALNVEQQKKEARRFPSKSVGNPSLTNKGNPSSSSYAASTKASSFNTRPETRNPKPVVNPNATKKCFKCQG